MAIFCSLDSVLPEKSVKHLGPPLHSSRWCSKLKQHLGDIPNIRIVGKETSKFWRSTKLGMIQTRTSMSRSDDISVVSSSSLSNPRGLITLLNFSMLIHFQNHWAKSTLQSLQNHFWFNTHGQSRWIEDQSSSSFFVAKEAYRNLRPAEFSGLMLAKTNWWRCLYTMHGQKLILTASETWFYYPESSLNKFVHV